MFASTLASLALLQATASTGTIVMPTDPLAAIASTQERTAARRCRARLEQRAGGAINTIEISRFVNTARRTVVAGTLRASLRPPSKPGEMTPNFIVSAPFAFRCTLARGRVKSVSTDRLKD